MQRILGSMSMLGGFQGTDSVSVGSLKSSNHSHQYFAVCLSQRAMSVVVLQVQFRLSTGADLWFSAFGSLTQPWFLPKFGSPLQVHIGSTIV